MREEGVAALVVGVDEESSEEALALAEKHEHLLPRSDCIRIMPDQRTFPMKIISRTRRTSESCRDRGVRAGLFPFTKQVTKIKSAQKELFKKHIELAAELDKPLIIHCAPEQKERTMPIKI